MLDQVTLAKRLKEARQRSGLTQAEVARLTGLDRSTLSKIETGERKIDSLELHHLSRLYNVSVEELLFDKHEEETQLRFVTALREYSGHSETAREDIRHIEEFCANYRLLVELMMGDEAHR